MITATDKKIAKTVSELEELDKTVRKKLFEVETLMSLREVAEGRTTRVKSVRALFATLGK